MPAKKCGFCGSPGLVMCAECFKVLCKNCDDKFHKDPTTVEHKRLPIDRKKKPEPEPVPGPPSSEEDADDDDDDDKPPAAPEKEKKKKKKFHWHDQVVEWGVPFKDSMALAALFMKWGHTEEDIDPDILDAKRLLNIGIDGTNLQLCVVGVSHTYAKNNPEKIEQQKREAEEAAKRWKEMEEEDKLREKVTKWDKTKSKTVLKMDATKNKELTKEEEEYEEALKSNEKMRKKQQKEAEKSKRPADWFSWQEQLQEWGVPVQDAKRISTMLEKAKLTKKEIDPVHFTEDKMRDLGISGTNLRLVMSGMKEHYQNAQLAALKLSKVSPQTPAPKAKVKLEDSDDDLPPAPYYCD